MSASWELRYQYYRNLARILRRWARRGPAPAQRIMREAASGLEVCAEVYRAERGANNGVTGAGGR